MINLDYFIVRLDYNVQKIGLGSWFGSPNSDHQWWQRLTNTAMVALTSAAAERTFKDAWKRTKD